MKIGILTYHRTLNYGACLQALATRSFLEEIGHEVYYIDYWPEYHKAQYKPFSKYKFREYNIKGKIHYLVTLWHYSAFLKRRAENFAPFMNKFILPYCKPMSETYDIAIYGSDQIWRKQTDGKYNPIYFGANDIIAAKHVSFSASMGMLPETIESELSIKEYLSHLDKIAVREESLLEYITRLGFVGAVKTLDPTLLMSASFWNKCFPIYEYSEQRYILVYNLWGDAFDMDSVYKYAENHRLQVIKILGDAKTLGDKNTITIKGPDTFVDLIRNAELVFTSSFHGLAFSLIYERQVYASFTNNSERAKSLLDDAGIPERLIPPKMKFEIGKSSIDYAVVNKKLDVLRQKSMKYLKTL